MLSMSNLVGLLSLLFQTQIQHRVASNLCRYLFRAWYKIASGKYTVIFIPCNFLELCCISKRKQQMICPCEVKYSRRFYDKRVPNTKHSKHSYSAYISRLFPLSESGLLSLINRNTSFHGSLEFNSSGPDRAQASAK